MNQPEVKEVGTQFTRTVYPKFEGNSDRLMRTSTLEVTGHIETSDLFGNKVVKEIVEVLKTQEAESSFFWTGGIEALFSIAEPRVPIAFRFGLTELVFDKDSIAFELDGNRLLVKAAPPKPAPPEEGTLLKQGENYFKYTQDKWLGFPCGACCIDGGPISPDCKEPVPECKGSLWLLSRTETLTKANDALTKTNDSLLETYHNVSEQLVEATGVSEIIPLDDKTDKETLVHVWGCNITKGLSSVCNCDQFKNNRDDITVNTDGKDTTLETLDSAIESLGDVKNILGSILEDDFSQGSVELSESEQEHSEVIDEEIRKQQ